MGMEILGNSPSRSEYIPFPSGRVSRSAHGRARSDTEELRLSGEEVNKLVAELQTSTERMNRRLKFTVNEELGRVVVKVIDANTDTVIKELPPESLQRIQARMSEAIGLLFDENM